MKKQFLIFLLILIVPVVFAGAFIVNISAESDGENIVVKWTTSQEIDLNHFVVERRSVNSSFGPISENISAKGSNSNYEFVDQNAYKTTDAVYIYRLKIVSKNGDIEHSGEISVSHSVSSVRRTWGSIKALFR